MRVCFYAMPSNKSWIFFLIFFLGIFNFVFAGDPFVYYDWTISYITASPLGVKQQVFFPVFLMQNLENFEF